MGMWMGIFLYSERAGGRREPLAFPPWNSQAAHPIPAVRRNAGMQRGEGGGVGGTEGEDGRRNPAECWNAAGIPGPVRSQDTNFGWESLPRSQVHSCRFVNCIVVHPFPMIFRRFSSATSAV
jgi:hypothetical protein